MALLIQPVVNTVLAILKARAPALCAAAGVPGFLDYGKLFTGASVNIPALWVMPTRTTFDVESQHTDRQLHELMVEFAVAAAEPDELTRLAMVYMAVLHQALRAAVEAGDFTGAVAGGNVQLVFIAAHDYGALLANKSGGLARFPALTVHVIVEEL